MRIALLSDIHGNLAALEAVLADIGRSACDAVAVLGDVVNAGPDSDRCYRRLRAEGVPMLRGNHERYVVEAADGAPFMRAPNWAPARFCAGQFAGAEIEELRALPRTLGLRDVVGRRAAALPPLLLCHAAPDDDRTHLHPATPAAEARAAFAGRGAATVARGHNHQPFERRLDGPGGALHVIALGAAGLPLDGLRLAHYALVEPDGGDGWRVEHRRVRYDVAAAAAAFHERGLIAAGGVMARLALREVLTGGPQVVPFMRYRAELPDETPLEAVFERFVRRGTEPDEAAQGIRRKR